MATDEQTRGPGFTLVDSPGEGQARAAKGEGIPAIDFSTFVLSLGTSALYQLGLVAGPEGATEESPNLALARQTIETLEMLSVKTRGNLETEESKLLDSLLYELRVKFVEASN